MTLSKNDLFKIYSWFDYMKGNMVVLEEEDYKVAKKIRKELLK